MSGTKARTRDETEIRRLVEERITHEHSSTPFYMDGSGRAANDLRPETSNG